MSLEREAFVVVRAAGERTTDACLALLSETLQPEQVRVIRERPFEMALRRSYELGIESQSEWLITIDADLLLRSDAVANIVSFARAQPGDVFQFQPLILDKFSGGFRRAGIRLYRTSLLKKAMSLIPEPGAQYRPEGYVVKAMGRLGYRTMKSESVAGIHDYEQYFRDVYRKCVVHGHKHVQWMPNVLPEWKKRAIDDIDFWIAIHGFWAGVTSRDGVKLDIDMFPRSVDDILVQVHAVEKPALHDCEITPSFVESILAQADPPPRRRTLRDVHSRLGWGRMAPWIIGKGLSRLGTTLQDFAGAGHRPRSSGPLADQ